MQKIWPKYRQSINRNLSNIISLLLMVTSLFFSALSRLIEITYTPLCHRPQTYIPHLCSFQDRALADTRNLSQYLIIFLVYVCGSCQIPSVHFKNAHEGERKRVPLMGGCCPLSFFPLLSAVMMVMMVLTGAHQSH